MELTIIVPFYNGHATIGRLLKTLPEGVPVVIVDDLSDEPLQLNREGTTIIRPEKKGFFSGAVNVGIRSVQTDVLVLNQDAWFDDRGWMELLAEKRDEYALIGDGVMRHPAWPKGYVQGTFMFIRRDAWEKVGKFNVVDYPLWGATCEWQLRACRNGFKALPLESIAGLKHRERGRFGYAIGTALRRWPNRRREFLKTPPELSIIVPCYNYGRFLDDCINSLLGGPTCLGEWEPQTFQSFEIIIVDDASTDEATVEKVRELHDPWKGIRSYLLNQNRGTPFTINVGVEQARGEYIHILSADDMRESWALEKQYRAAAANPGKVIYGDIEAFKSGQRLKVLKLPSYYFEDMLYKNPMPAGITYPKQAWVDVGGYPTRMVYGREDWAFNVGLGVKGYCGLKLKGLSGNLCRREGANRSVRTQGKGWYNRFLSQLVSLYPQIYEGERPVGCCGGSRTRRVPRATRGSQVSAATIVPGKTGMRLLEYVGGNTGSQTFWGPVTGNRYVFGSNNKDRVKYVDAEDYEDMLEMMKGRRPIFSVYVMPVEEPDLELEPEEAERVNPPELAKEVEIDATPSAIRLAEKLGLDLAEVVGSGKDGRILRKDVLAFDGTY